MPLIDKYLELATTNRASDIHFASGEPVRMRVDGDLVAVSESPFENDPLTAMMFEICTEQEQEKLVKTKNLDKSYAVDGVGFFRVNIFYTRRGMSAVLRTIPVKIPTMEQLGLPDSVHQLASAAKGLVLVTGPTGSGKSTTLAAIINHINTNYPYHILTAEDPVEFVHSSKQSLINQREIGSSCQTFSDALKYALREDPDVILVGEMRDLETIGLALTAAETGHLVFGTLHTRGAGASVDRIIDSFPANQQAMIRAMLAESLVGVISQTLLKRCDKPGRVAALEILIVTHAVANLIREGKTFQLPSIMQTARKDGMILMDNHILELVNKGIVDPEEAAPYMEHPQLVAGKKSLKVDKDEHAPVAAAKPIKMAPPPPTSAPVVPKPVVSAAPPPAVPKPVVSAAPPPPVPAAKATEPARAPGPPSPAPKAASPVPPRTAPAPAKPVAAAPPPRPAPVAAAPVEPPAPTEVEPMEEEFREPEVLSEAAPEELLSEEDQDRIGTQAFDTRSGGKETTGIYEMESKDEYAESGEAGSVESAPAPEASEPVAAPAPKPRPLAAVPRPPAPATAPPRPASPPPSVTKPAVAAKPSPPATPEKRTGSLPPPPPPKRKVG